MIIYIFVFVLIFGGFVSGCFELVIWVLFRGKLYCGWKKKDVGYGLWVCCLVELVRGWFGGGWWFYMIENIV